MKKKYFLILLMAFFATVSFGQELLLNGGLEEWETDKKPKDWKKAENLVKSTEKHGGSFSAFRDGGSKTKDLSQEITGIIPGASYTISFWYKASGDGTDARIWSVWKKGTSIVYHQGTSSDAKNDVLRGPKNGYLVNNGGVWSKHEVTVTAPADVDTFVFEVRSYSGSQVYWDDLSFVKNTTVSPSLSITSPNDGEVFTSPDVAVKLSVQNFNVAQSGGDGHIHYTVDGGSMVMKYDTNDIQLTGLSEGEHSIQMELVDNAHQPLNPVVKTQVNFKVSSFTKVSTIAALRAGTVGQFYELTEEAYLTYARSFRGQKYIQDATGGILIDDNDKVIKTTYKKGDGIKGLKGKLSEYKGVTQFVPSVDPGVASSTGNAVNPEEVNLAKLSDNVNKYESKIVKIKKVTFVNANGNFEKGKSYEIKDDSSVSARKFKATSLTFRTNFYEADYIGKPIPTTAVDLVVLVSENKGKAQVTAIDLSGITALGLDKNQIVGFNVYPNPVTNKSFSVITNSASEKEVSVYNVLGKNVFNHKFVGNRKSFTVANLTNGIYILKVKEDGKVATKKLVIK